MMAKIGDLAGKGKIVKVGVNYGGGGDRGEFGDFGNLPVSSSAVAPHWAEGAKGSPVNRKSRAGNISSVAPGAIGDLHRPPGDRQTPAKTSRSRETVAGNPTTARASQPFGQVSMGEAVGKEGGHL